MFLNDALALKPWEKATSEEYNYSEGHIVILSFSFLFLVEKEPHKGFLGGQCCRQELDQRTASCSHTLFFATSLNVVMLSEVEWK